MLMLCLQRSSGGTEESLNGEKREQMTSLPVIFSVCVAINFSYCLDVSVK